jgi:sugar lactone lactonase YvrE
MKFFDPRRLCLFVCAIAITAALKASSTTEWEMNSYQDFIHGRFQGISLSRDGRLMLAPKIDAVFSSDQPVVWSVAAAPDGSLYAGTGHRGRLYRIDPSGKSSLVWTAEQPEIFAVAVDAKGAVYAATSPDGKIYRVADGKATEYFAPQAKYIWSLAVSADGGLYAGTGDQGKVFRVDSAGKGEVFYATGQSHVTGLAVDGSGRVLAGTEPNGILYRISAKDKAFVLYDAALPEIRAISSAPDGTIYAVAMGGSLAKRTQGIPQSAPASAGAPVVSATGTSITVTAESAQTGPEIKPQPEQPKPVAPAPPPVTATFTPALDVSGVDKSAVYKINPDNTVETLWSSKEENVYDLLPWKGQLLFATDANGRIYRLSPDRKLTLIAQTNDAEATRLVGVGDSVLAATGNMGRIYRLEDALAASGVYEAPVHDTGGVAQWGHIVWHADDSNPGSISFRTRTGNSLRPDNTWSDWSAALTGPAGSKISSPNARYIQWKAEFAGAQGKTPALESVSVAYLPQNTPPIVRSITVGTQLAATGAGKPQQQASMAAYSVTVTDTGDAAPALSSGTPTQTPSRAASQQINVSWQAEDPDGDRLVYSLWFRGEGERDWKLLKANMHESTFSLDGDAVADGKYFFRVMASDREVNPPGLARDAELVSSPVLIDNTPPVVTPGTPRRTANGVEVDFEAVDAASALRRCEYSLDAGSWIPLEAVDGVIDSPREKFVVRLEHLASGEHVLTLRAVDSANNAGLAKVILR